MMFVTARKPSRKLTSLVASFTISVLVSTPAATIVTTVATKTLTNARSESANTQIFHGDIQGPCWETSHTDDGHDIHLVHCARQSAKEANNQTNNTKDQSASAMVCQNIHQNVEGQDITGHEENQKQ